MKSVAHGLEGSRCGKLGAICGLGRNMTPLVMAVAAPDSLLCDYVALHSLPVPPGTAGAAPWIHRAQSPRQKMWRLALICIVHWLLIYALVRE